MWNSPSTIKYMYPLLITYNRSKIFLMPWSFPSTVDFIFCISLIWFGLYIRTSVQKFWVLYYRTLSCFFSFGFFDMISLQLMCISLIIIKFHSIWVQFSSIYESLNTINIINLISFLHQLIFYQIQTFHDFRKHLNSKFTKNHKIWKWKIHFLNEIE